MIDSQCAIVKLGKGFCWCPTSAWGEMDDDELCRRCMLKHMICRFCGGRGACLEDCIGNQKSAKVIKFRVLHDELPPKDRTRCGS